jgi:hypothetical protein
MAWLHQAWSELGRERHLTAWVQQPEEVEAQKVLQVPQVLHQGAVEEQRILDGAEEQLGRTPVQSCCTCTDHIHRQMQPPVLSSMVVKSAS